MPQAAVSASASSSPLQETFDESLLAAARQLVSDGAVGELRVLQSGMVVTGVVNVDASSKQRHRVYIRRAGSPGELRIVEAECSCGNDARCVHVAAVTVAAVEQSGSSLTQQRTESSSRSVSRTPQESAVSAAPGLQLLQRLFYVLQAAGDDRERELQLSVWVAQLAPGSQKITRGSASPFVARTTGGSEFPRYVDSEDRQILPGLLAQRNEGPWTLRGVSGASVLNQVISTKRALWQTLEGSPLRVGKPRSAQLSWQLLSNGDQQLRCVEPAHSQVLMHVEPPMYVDGTSNEIGALTLPCSVERVRQHWNAPPVSPEQTATVNEEIAASRVGLPELCTLTPEAQALRSLSARLHLAAGPTASLHFVYNGLPVDNSSLRNDSAKVRIVAAEQRTTRAGTGSTSPSVASVQLYEIVRDISAERQLQSRFDLALARRDQGGDFWLPFVLVTVPQLQADGWEVLIDDDFPYRLAGSIEWYADADTRRDREWFDLKLGMVVDGQQVNLLPALVDYLQGALGNGEAGCRRVGEQLFVLLPDGRYLPVPIDRIKRIADTLVELFEHDALDKQQTLSLPVTQASRLAQLTAEVEAPVLRSPDSALLESVAELRNFTAIQPLQAPHWFNASLRPYQQEGLGWLQFLRRCRLGGVLADDMGLGKTVQTLAHLALEKEAGRLQKPSLIISPVSVIGNWEREIRQLAPQLKSLTLHGPRRKELFSSIPNVDIVITAYPLLLLDSEVLTTHEFYLLVMDEAQFIKNPRAKVSQAARALRAEHRLCLSGTPMENHLGELWALVDFLQPGLLGEEREFQRQYRTAIERNEDRERAQALSRRIAPFVLRRTKDAVAPDLPAKTQIIETIALDEKQRDFYDGVRLASHRRVRETIEERGLARSQITVLDALLKLRQACCDPRLVGGEIEHEGIPSAKIDWLTNALPEMIEEGRRILLFSQFTSMLRLIEKTVQELNIPYLLLTGETRERTPLIEKFQSGAVPLFLISLKAGGTGLNLTAADTVIHYDPWWNPAVEAQATDRAHRIGQDKPVFVYKLIAQGTVEERIVRLQERKHALASQLYTEKNAAPLQLDASDLEMLFAP
jgi:superfamily II DNA or RNA helicase